MRVLLLVPALTLVAACTDVAPLTSTGFNTPEYQAQREAQLAGQGVAGNPLLAPVEVSQQPLGAPGTAPVATGENADIANQTAAALASTSGQNSAAVTAVPVANTGAISDEQDFAAVSERRTIENDAARIQQNAARIQRKVVLIQQKTM